MARRRTADGTGGPPLSRATVIAAAIELADRDGLQALTIRRLAGDLGVGAMSIYHYVPGKDAVLAGMLASVVEEMVVPGSGDWRNELRRSATSVHAVLMRHPWATDLMMGGPRPSPARLRLMEATLRRLRESGFGPEAADLAYHAIDSHVMGFTMWLGSVSAGMRRLGDIRKITTMFDADAYPYIAEHAQQHLRERRATEPGAFEFGLDLILDGLDRLRDRG